jgi:hypothetical protein
LQPDADTLGFQAAFQLDRPDALNV